MPFDLQVIRASEFVRVDTKGNFDFESTKQVLEALAHACSKRAIRNALLDVRGATSNLTPNELAALADSFFKSASSRNLRLGIVHNGNQHYRAKLFAFIGTLRRQKVRAFDEFEAALDWLSNTHSSASPRQEGGEEVPIGA